MTENRTTDEGETQSRDASGRVTPREIKIRCHEFDLAALDYREPTSASDRPAGRARPMLLVHGMRDLAWSMDSIAQAFADRYRVVSLDLRGHGDSGHPSYYAVPHFASDLYTTIGELGLERPVLVGHSFGGEITSQLAGAFPEIPSACVLIEGLGPPPFEGEGNDQVRRQMARMSIEALKQINVGGRRVADLDRAVARLREVHTGLDADRARFLAGKGTCPHPDGGLRWKWDPMLRTMFGSFSRDVMEERWGWIECPTQVVIGSESGTWWSRGRGPGAKQFQTTRSYLPPNELDRRLGMFQNVQCDEVDGAGHMIHFDRPAQLNAVIADFLTAHDLR